MGRIGVTYTDVAQAANAIQTKGDNPTIDSVRAWLGTGSKATIAPMLKQWRHEQAPFLKNPQTSLPPDLLALVHGLWEGLKAKSDQVLADEKDRHHRQLERLEQKQSELTQQLQEQTALNHRLETQLSDLKDANATLQTSHHEQSRQIEYLTGKNQALEQRVQDQATAATQLSDQAKMAYENLEHFRQSNQHQRETERLEWGQQQSQWQQQIHQAQASIFKLSSENKSLQEELDHLSHENTQLKTEKQTTERTIAKLNAEYAQVAEKNQEYKQQKTKDQQKQQTLSKTLEQTQQDNRRLQEQYQSLSIQLSEFSQINNGYDLNLMLNNRGILRRSGQKIHQT